MWDHTDGCANQYPLLNINIKYWSCFLRAMLVFYCVYHRQLLWLYLFPACIIWLPVIDSSRSTGKFPGFLVFHICCLYSTCIDIMLLWVQGVRCFSICSFMGWMHNYSRCSFVGKLGHPFWVLRGSWWSSILHAWDRFGCHVWRFPWKISCSIVIIIW